MPERIRLSRAKGFRLPDNAVNVARPSRLGNLFVVGKDGTRLQCAAKFYVLATGFIDLAHESGVEAQLALYQRIRRARTQLEGKDLACWCPLDGGACHADVLLLIANPDMAVPAWMTDPVDLPRPRIGMAARDLLKLNRAKNAEPNA